VTTSPVLTKPRLREIGSLALPIIAGLGSQNIMNLADAMMVGHLDAASLGAVGIAAIALWVVTSPFQGLSHAVQAITARRLGEGKQHQIHFSLVNGMGLVVALGIPYCLILLKSSPFLFQFLDNDPRVREIGTGYFSIRLCTIVFIGLNYCFRGYFNGRKQPMVFMKTLLVMHPLNIILNYVLIFGAFGFPEMGAEGAALGTAIATVVGTVCLFWLMYRQRNESVLLNWTALSKNAILGLMNLAWPNALQYLTLSCGFLAFYVIAGLVSTQALAATNVLVNLSRVCFIMAVGLGMATITLVGNALGEGRLQEARNAVYAVLIVGCLVLGVAGLCLALFPHFWLSCFGLDADVRALAVAPLVVLGLTQGYDAASIILSHAHLGGGTARRVMIISVLNQWVVFIPACFLWVQYFDAGLLQLWVCMAIYRFLLFLSFFLSFRGKYWCRSAI